MQVEQQTLLRTPANFNAYIHPKFSEAFGHLRYHSRRQSHVLRAEFCELGQSQGAKNQTASKRKGLAGKD
jgi:hypothetical protein